MMEPNFRTEVKHSTQIAKNISVIFITLISLTYGEFSQAQYFTEQRMEMVGDWNGEYIGVKEPEQDDVEDSELVERPDDINIDEFYTMTFNDRPVSFGLEYESNVEFFIDFELGRDAEDDLLVVEQILIPKVFYTLKEDISLYICLELF